MIATSELVTLQKTESKSFKGTDGALVEYVEAVILDNDGNKFTCTVDEDAKTDTVGLEKAEGIAKLALFVRSEIVTGKTGTAYTRAVVKMRLLGFTAEIA